LQQWQFRQFHIDDRSEFDSEFEFEFKSEFVADNGRYRVGCTDPSGDCDRHDQRSWRDGHHDHHR
jgi:hypothetical protein